jgi:hypothetical protein
MTSRQTTKNTNNASKISSPRRQKEVGTPTHVSEPAFEFLLHAMIEQVEMECLRAYNKQKKNRREENENKLEEMMTNLNMNVNNGNTNGSNNNNVDDKSETKIGEDEKPFDQKEEANANTNNNTTNANTNTTETTTKTTTTTTTITQKQKQIQTEQQQQEEDEKQYILMNENIAAKIERMGFDVGFRLVERLSQSKSLVPPNAQSNTPTQTALQLEAVKFICKEFWTEVFSKQIDKLQTNHRGVFVLKDGSFKWLDRMPDEMDVARVIAIKILALPCGLIRGALKNLGITADVSCDFWDDEKNMNSCSFNVKIK